MALPAADSGYGTGTGPYSDTRLGAHYPAGPGASDEPEVPKDEALAASATSWGLNTAAGNGERPPSQSSAKVAGLRAGLRIFIKVFRRHCVDWCVLLVLVIAWLLISGFAKPTHRYADVTYFATSPRFPVVLNDVVPRVPLLVISLIVPLVVLFLSFLVRRCPVDLHNSILGLLYSLVLALLVTAYVKVAAGRLRPDFFYACFPNGIPVYKANGDVDCTGEEDEIRQGRQAFFSGHASASAAGLGFIAVFLTAKCRSHDMKGHVSRFILPFLCLSGAALVAITRWTDYKHHFLDCLAGYLVGLFFAYLCYRQLYPSLRHPRAQLPFEDANGVRAEFLAQDERVRGHELPL